MHCPHCGKAIDLAAMRKAKLKGKPLNDIESHVKVAIESGEGRDEIARFLGVSRAAIDGRVASIVAKTGKRPTKKKRKAKRLPAPRENHRPMPSTTANGLY